MSNDQMLQIKLENIKSLATLSNQFGSDENRKRKFEDKIQNLLDDVLEPKKPAAKEVTTESPVRTTVAEAILRSGSSSSSKNSSTD